MTFNISVLCGVVLCCDQKRFIFSFNFPLSQIYPDHLVYNLASFPLEIFLQLFSYFFRVLVVFLFVLMFVLLLRTELISLPLVYLMYPSLISVNETMQSLV